MEHILHMVVAKISEVIYVKCLAQYLLYSKCYVNDGFY